MSTINPKFNSTETFIKLVYNQIRNIIIACNERIKFNYNFLKIEFQLLTLEYYIDKFKIIESGSSTCFFDPQKFRANELILLLNSGDTDDGLRIEFWIYG